MMNSGKIFIPLCFLLAILSVPYPVMGLEYQSYPEWAVPLTNSENPANQAPVIQVADGGRLISLNFPHEPVLFVYDESGTRLFNTTLSAEKTPWISSVSLVPDGSGLVVTQLVPGCCHGSVSNTSSDKVIFFDRSGRIIWEYVTYSPPLASAVLPDTRDIVVGTEDGKILCLDENGQVRWTTRVEAPVISLTASADGSTIVAAGDSNYDAWKQYGEPLVPYDLFFLGADGTVLGKYQTRGQNTVAVSRDASVIAVIGGPLKNLMVFNRTGAKTGDRSFPGTVSALSMTGDGTRIVVETSDGRIWCMDNDLRETCDIPAAPGSQGIAVSDTGETIAFGNNRSVTIYTRSGELLGIFPGESRVRFISPVPGSGSFIVGAEQKMIFFNVTASGSYGTFPPDQQLPADTPATAAPLPLLVVMIALGLCFLLSVMVKKDR
jgi:outer membrane protein assembly factor BamB